MEEPDKDVLDIRERIDHFLQKPNDLRDQVRSALSDVLHCAEEQLTIDGSLVGEFGADSLDFVDVVFRLEERYRVVIPLDAIEEAVARADNAIIDGRLSERGLQRIRTLMPELCPRLTTSVKPNEIQTLFTAETFVRLVAWRLCDAAVAPAS